MDQPDRVGVIYISAQSPGFQARSAKKPQFLPLLLLMMGKEARKSLPCAFLLRSGITSSRVEMEMFKHLMYCPHLKDI